MSSARRAPAHVVADEAVVVRGWRVRSTVPPGSSGHEHLAVGWRLVVGSVACWPGLGAMVERRFHKPRQARVREYVLAACPALRGGESVASDELDALTRPVRGRLFASAVSRRALERLLELRQIGYLAEVRGVSVLAPEGAEAFAESLASLIDALSALGAEATLSLLVSTPPLPPDEGEEDWSIPRMLEESPLATAPPQLAAVARPVCFRLRLTSSGPLPSSLLALAGSMVLGPGAVGGQGWHLACGPRRLAAARRELCRLGVGIWNGDEQVLSASAVVATALSLSAACPALDAALAPGAPATEAPSREGALVGGVRLACGRMAPAGVAWDQRSGHSLVVGASGTGKSTAVSHLILDDLEAGRGLVVLDPHGDLAELALQLVPSRRRREVVLVDPIDPRAAAIDLIPAACSEHPRDVAARLADAMEELHNPRGSTGYIGPVFQQAVQMAVQALLTSTTAPRPVTLSHVEQMLLDDRLRSGVLSGLDDHYVIGYWHDYAKSARSSDRGLDYFTSKLSTLTDGPGRAALAQPASYRLEQLLARQHILICRLPVGELGFAAGRFLGRLVLSRLLGALTAQGRRPPAQRAQTSLVIDEAQLLAGGEVVERLLSQARKFGASLTLANQNPSQLGSETLASVLTNTAVLMLFRLPRSEAAWFADRTGARAAEHLPQLPNYHALLITPDTTRERPLSLQTSKPRPPDPTAGRRTRTTSLKHHGQPPEPQQPGQRPAAR